MAERMVRTQIYLPPKVHAELKRRAEKHRLSLALQIREALEDYLRRTNSAGDELEPIDLENLFKITAQFGGSGLSDASVNHDKYIYGDPHGEIALEKERLRTQVKQASVSIMREHPVSYKTKKRSPAKRRVTRG